METRQRTDRSSDYITLNTKHCGHPQDLLADTLVSANQIARMVGVKIGTTWAWARTISDFPKPIRLSPRCTRWRKSEIEAWLESRRTA